jgi:divalent metal cation (Fe/Co/Zn/Cd) transporter
MLQTIQLISPAKRKLLHRRAVRLELFTVGYNTLEGIISVLLGLLAGSVALVGFGLDSAVEVLSGLVILWRFTRKERDAEHAERLERRSVLLVGLSFFVLAAYVGWEAVTKVFGQEQAEASWGGIALAILSLLIMPWLARQKKRTAFQLNSRSLSSDATQTSLCAYLSAVLLVGLVLNALFGWWWADPVVSLGIVGWMVKEGWENIEVARGRKEGGCCDEC